MTWGTFRYLLSLLLLLSAVISRTDAKERFLIIHLDGTCTTDFFCELEKGNLPNLAELINQGYVIPHALSLFPGATEIIVPRLEEGLDNSQGEFIAWGNYYRETGRKTGKPTIFIKLNQAMPRRSLSCFLFGIPGLHYLNGHALLNTAGLFELYDTVHYYWFSTDTLGHIFGREYHHRDLQRFDGFFGKLREILDDDINIIIYMDHGMSFDVEDTINPRKEICRYIDSGEILAVIPPNIFLDDNSLENVEKNSRKLIKDSMFDFVFHRIDDNTVKGYTREACLFFRKKGDRYSYDFTGTDVLGYYLLGYDGGFLSADEWLELTCRHKYPGAPVNIFRYLSNPHTGDIVAVVNPPVIPVDLHAVRAHHAGITGTDLTVPVLLKGNALKHLYGEKHIWLHTLFQKIPELDLSAEPGREKNCFAYYINRKSDEENSILHLSFSPAYRWRLNARFSDEKSLWAERDVFAGYFLRVWLGAGIRRHESTTGAVATIFSELRYRRFSFNALLSYPKKSSSSAYCLNYKLTDTVQLTWLFPKNLGLKLSW